MIQYADKTMIDELKDLWNMSFPGDEKYCNLFFDICFESQKCLILKEKDEIVSALYMLDTQTYINGNLHPSVYLYAISTSEKYRGKGYATRLINEALSNCKNNGIDFVYLTSVSGLHKFYENLGFADKLYLDCRSFIPKTPKFNIDFKICSFEEFKAMRNKYLSDIDNSIVWDDRPLRYMYSELSQHGKILSFSINNIEYYAVLTTDGKNEIKETNCPDNYFQDLANSVEKSEKIENELFITCPCKKYINQNKNENIKYAGHYIKFTKVQNPSYFNLTGE